jgi:hypothetical protein
VSRRGQRVEQQAGAGAGAASVAQVAQRKAVRALTQAHRWSSHAGRAATNGWRSTQERVQAARAWQSRAGTGIGGTGTGGPGKRWRACEWSCGRGMAACEQKTGGVSKT